MKICIKIVHKNFKAPESSLVLMPCVVRKNVAQLLDNACAVNEGVNSQTGHIEPGNSDCGLPVSKEVQEKIQTNALLATRRGFTMRG